MNSRVRVTLRYLAADLSVRFTIRSLVGYMTVTGGFAFSASARASAHGPDGTGRMPMTIAAATPAPSTRAPTIIRTILILVRGAPLVVLQPDGVVWLPAPAAR